MRGSVAAKVCDFTVSRETGRLPTLTTPLPVQNSMKTNRLVRCLEFQNSSGPDGKVSASRP
jgi:hypothetical protein